MNEPVKTPLYATHLKLNARIVDFHGFLMPVQYSSILNEHKAVRTEAGIFDVSHMGEFLVEGEDAEKALNHLVTNDVRNMVDFQCQYSPMCYANGTTVDDLILMRFHPRKYLIVVNASNIDKDFEWMQKNLQGSLTLKNVSDQYSLLALQGPKAVSLAEGFFGVGLADLGTYHFRELSYREEPLLLSRTGYSGEDGLEIFCSNTLAPELFLQFVEAGALPCGLGCRDTLRLEARLPLYGNELSDAITPLEAGLKRFVALDKPFIGSSQIEAQSKYKLHGIEIEDRQIARQGTLVFLNETDTESSGFVTSGSFCPTLSKSCAMLLLNTSLKPGATVHIEVRGRRRPAKIVKMPFYRREKA